jgi:hypothetical protein
MNNNVTFYAIITYITIIIIIFYIKPDFIYDHSKKKFKEFGMENDQTVLTLPVLAIIISVLIYVIFSSLFTNNINMNNTNTLNYPTLPQYYNLNNNVNNDFKNNIIKSGQNINQPILNMYPHPFMYYPYYLPSPNNI